MNELKNLYLAERQNLMDSVKFLGHRCVPPVELANVKVKMTQVFASIAKCLLYKLAINSADIHPKANIFSNIGALIRKYDRFFLFCYGFYSLHLPNSIPFKSAY